MTTKPFSKEIRTERLLLRVYDNGYEAELLDLLLKNKAHLKPVLSSWVYNISSGQDLVRLIKTAKMGYALKNLFAFCVWDLSLNKIVGEIVLFNVNWNEKKIELGSYIYKEFEGRGIITEAKKASLAYCFKELGMQTVEAVCASDNLASHKVNFKCGFDRFEGQGNVVFRMTKEQFETLSPGVNVEIA